MTEQPTGRRAPSGTVDRGRQPKVSHPRPDAPVPIAGSAGASERIKELETGLAFYANEANWRWRDDGEGGVWVGNSEANDDGGAHARSLLSEAAERLPADLLDPARTVGDPPEATQVGSCEWCGHALRLFMDPRPGPAPRPNYRCDCEGANHAVRVFTDPTGRVYPESHAWVAAHRGSGS